MRQLRVALAQINTTVGDFDGNVKKITTAIETARQAGANIVAVPELAVCGYPPEDLLFKPQFIKANIESLHKIAASAKGITAIVGFVDSNGGIYNAAAVLHDGKIAGIYHKILLPNYGVFDEERYFKPGNECPVWVIDGVKVGITVCEDIWYADGPPNVMTDAGAEVIINISASPYHVDKGTYREHMIAGRATAMAVPFAYCNAVGGQDELVFDGHSLIINEHGEIIARGKQFKEDMLYADLDIEAIAKSGAEQKRQPGQIAFVRPHKTVVISAEPSAPPAQPITARKADILSLPAEVYHALALGTRDYIHKNGFQKVLIGLSGGIDSSIVAAVAVDALGPDNVMGVSMPSRYSSDHSKTDAQQLAQNLKIKFLTIPIEKVYSAYLDTLEGSFGGAKPDTTEENIQARIRGNLLMALSNKFGWLVLTTGNKSEYATGYTTLYGDMAGGFAVIKDVPKTMVYKISRYCNEKAGFNLIPESVFTKPPSAELRPDQKDSDSLPVYETLDPILTAYVEDNRSVEQIIGLGFEKATVQRAAKLVDLSEYKRRQAPPGVKITPRAFGRDRRLPITNRFREW